MKNVIVSTRMRTICLEADSIQVIGDCVHLKDNSGNNIAVFPLGETTACYFQENSKEVPESEQDI